MSVRGRQGAGETQSESHAGGQAGVDEEARFVSPGQQSSLKVRQDRPADRQVKRETNVRVLGILRMQRQHSMYLHALHGKEKPITITSIRLR